MSNLASIATAVSETLEKERARAKYMWDPVLWAREVAGIHLWSKQAEIAKAVAENQNVVVKAGHGVGKSFLAALLICWWVDTRYDTGFVASTAPSTAQISAVVWREISTLSSRIEKRYKEGLVDHVLPGYRTSGDTPQWKTDEGVVIGFGRKPPDEKVDSAFQGIHASGGVLVVGDEAVGLTEELIDAMGNITTTDNSRRFLICNPTNPLSYVAKLFKTKPDNWVFLTISVMDNPNFTGEEAPEEVLRGLSDQSFVDSKRAEYGEGSPRWISRILGEFAYDMGFTLFTHEDGYKALDTCFDEDPDAPLFLGVDLSRSKAGDQNTIYSFQNGRLRFVDAWNSRDAMVTAEKIIEIAREHNATEVRVDGAGLGGPVVDRLVQLSEEDDFEIIEVLGGEASPDKTQWANMRAWGYATMQTRMSNGFIDVDVDTWDKLGDQLLGIELKKKTTGNDVILLESKEDMRRRGLSSPDHADAAMYACLDLSPWTGNALNHLTPGSKVVMEPEPEKLPGYDPNMWLEAMGCF